MMNFNQNALNALRHQQHIVEGSDGEEWEGLRHYMP